MVLNMEASTYKGSFEHIKSNIATSYNTQTVPAASCSVLQSETRGK